MKAHVNDIPGISLGHDGVVEALVTIDGPSATIPLTMFVNPFSRKMHFAPLNKSKGNDERVLAKSGRLVKASTLAYGDVLAGSVSVHVGDVEAAATSYQRYTFSKAKSPVQEAAGVDSRNNSPQTHFVADVSDGVNTWRVTIIVKCWCSHDEDEQTAAVRIFASGMVVA